MDQEVRARFREQLTNMKAERTERLKSVRTVLASERSDGSLGGIDPGSGDHNGSHQQLTLAVAGDRAGHLSDELKSINQALRGIENGTYGVCQECEGEISEARLNALPFAVRCTPCQERIERQTE